MQLTIPQIPTNAKLIPVASEVLPCLPQELKEINGLKVFDYYEYKKSDAPPLALLFLCFKQEINPKTIWVKYYKSEIIYFFICYD